jgi:hypothetical protein
VGRERAGGRYSVMVYPNQELEIVNLVLHMT